MAYVKMMNGDLEDTLNYIRDQSKTRNDAAPAPADGIRPLRGDPGWIRGINCSRTYALEEMKAFQDFCHRPGSVSCRHFILSFVKDELSPEKAMEFASEAAERMWGDEYQILIALHRNTQNIHCHYAVNPVSLRSRRKLPNELWVLEQFREITNQICKEYGIQSFPDSTETKNPENYWIRTKSSSRFLAFMRGEIRTCRALATSNTDFLQLLKESGYLVDQESQTVTLSGCGSVLPFSQILTDSCPDLFRPNGFSPRFQDIRKDSLLPCYYTKARLVRDVLRWNSLPPSLSFSRLTGLTAELLEQTERKNCRILSPELRFCFSDPKQIRELTEWSERAALLDTPEFLEAKSGCLGEELSRINLHLRQMKSAISATSKSSEESKRLQEKLSVLKNNRTQCLNEFGALKKDHAFYQRISLFLRAELSLEAELLPQRYEPIQMRTRSRGLER